MSFCGKLGKGREIESGFIAEQVQIYTLMKFQLTKKVHNEKNFMGFAFRNTSVSAGKDFFGKNK